MQKKRRKKGKKSIKMAIKISIFEKKDPNTVKLLIAGVDQTYINTLRRSMSAEVPVMAIEDLEIRKNHSILYDEILAHRLGLIPFKTDLSSYEIFNQGDQVNAKNSLKMVLKAKGPGYIYASQIKTKDPKVVPVYPKMPIVKLLEGQEIELEAVAILGKGKTHSKWSPGLFHYHQATKINIKKQPSAEEQEKIMNSFPQGLFEIKAGKLAVKSQKIEMECEDFEQAHPDIDVETTDEYIFGIESWGQLTPKELVKTAIDEFDKQLSEFQEELKKVK